MKQDDSKNINKKPTGFALWDPARLREFARNVSQRSAQARQKKAEERAKKSKTVRDKLIDVIMARDPKTMLTSELLGYLDRLLRYEDRDKKYCNECGKLLVDDYQAHREIKKAEKIQQALAVEKLEAKPQVPLPPQPDVKQPKKPWPAEPPATCFESDAEELARLRRESAYRQRQMEQWIRETYEEI